MTYVAQESIDEISDAVAKKINELPVPQPDVPDKNVGDIISRQAAIKLLEEWADGYSYLEVPVSSIAPKLNELPTAEKKGRWVKDDEQNHVEMTWHCDQCGAEAWGFEELTFYCPMCGTRMVNVEDCEDDAYEEDLEEFLKNPKTYTLGEVEAELGLTAEKKGKWEIDVDHEYDIFDIEGERTWATKATCSECGFTMRFIEGHGVFNYCPNCGCRMTEESE